MISSKRRTPTTDDLLRRQEEPQKRHKKPSLVEIYESDDDNAEDLEVEGDGNEGEESTDSEVSLVELARSGGLDDDSSLLGSRISTKPRLVYQPPTSPGAGPSKHKHVTFSSLGISPPLLSVLSKMAIHTPTEIQRACIPPLLAGRDCIGNAKTGSGKTIAFALPILQKLSMNPYGIFALVLTPTRELAFQIAEQFAVLGAPLNARTAIIVGGMDMIAQAIELDNRPHVVVATPGRLVDHIRSSSAEWDLSRVKFLILDEADRLLAPSFADDLAYLFGVLPKERQTALFTATWTQSIGSLADAVPKPGKQRPFIYKITSIVETVESLKQHYVLVPSHVRESYLFYLLCNPPESILHLRRQAPKPIRRSGASAHEKVSPRNTSSGELLQPPPTIVFCAKARTVAYLTAITALHSRLTQRDRLSSLSLFRSSVIPVLVSTDVGARGLDIADVAMVVNWDLPDEPEVYTHRVGRTARAGRGGVAFSFVSENDENRLTLLGTRLEEMELPEDKVLEKLNKVSTAKRQAYMELYDTKFGQRERTNRAKAARADSY
ncbi:P-loop containing nucleoside triphosphate hydrolase protein [Russula earlei]|uniref:P-loop containing nucleoside triphosphate hydrolase protein n=1 Tax=Russula earlei TaxID=71964 RepID=A0ACC0UC60_9AGAM|nr:P-loop containing nucleoside triphosphate hydrolase protein [Russula earlei]